MAKPENESFIPKEQIGQILIERGFIDEKKLKEALSLQKKENSRIGEILIKHGYVQEMDIVVALVIQCHIPYISIHKYKINQKVLKIVPKEIATRYHLVPLDLVGNVLSLVMSDPLDQKIINELKKATGYKIARFIATHSEIDEALVLNY